MDNDVTEEEEELNQRRQMYRMRLTGPLGNSLNDDNEDVEILALF